MYFTQIKNFIDKDVQKNISNRKQAASFFDEFIRQEKQNICNRNKNIDKRNIYKRNIYKRNICKRNIDKKNIDKRNKNIGR